MPCSICREVGHNSRRHSGINNCTSFIVTKKKKMKPEKDKINLKKTPLSSEEYAKKEKKFKETRTKQYDLANDCVQSLIEGKISELEATFTQAEIIDVSKLTGSETPSS